MIRTSTSPSPDHVASATMKWNGMAVGVAVGRAGGVGVAEGTGVAAFFDPLAAIPIPTPAPTTAPAATRTPVLTPPPPPAAEALWSAAASPTTDPENRITNLMSFLLKPGGTGFCPSFVRPIVRPAPSAPTTGPFTLQALPGTTGGE